MQRRNADHVGNQVDRTVAILVGRVESCPEPTRTCARPIDVQTLRRVYFRRPYRSLVSLLLFLVR